MLSDRADSDSLRPQLLLLAAATLLCLLPFIAKPFNIDEPLFIWAAKQIAAHPFDFYGFKVNWYGTEMSAAEVIKNPPLASYYLAAVGTLFGWSEISLHTAFLLPALAAVIGTYLLGRELSQPPLPATLLALLSPAFIISSTTVMCDTMMLAFYVWAVYLWIRGMKCDSGSRLLLASLLVGLCSLTKYFGMSLVPLLLLYSICSGAKRGRHALFLVIPVLILLGYQLWTKGLYGRGLLLDAADYANSSKSHSPADLAGGLITGLSFLGGCFLPTLFFAPLIWSRAVLLAGAAAVPLLASLLALVPFPRIPVAVPWSYYAEMSLYVIAALNLLALAVLFLRRERNAEALLLFCWVAGTFVFAAFVNWSVNGRSLLPMAPAVGVIVAGTLAAKGKLVGGAALPRSRAFLTATVCAILLSMTLAWGDDLLAGTARRAARRITRSYRGRALTFQGHWGFQYYMEQEGAVAWDPGKRPPLPLAMAVPENNTNIDTTVMRQGTLAEVIQFPAARYFSTMNSKTRAGFYSSTRGALPFAFGEVPDERYAIVELR